MNDYWNTTSYAEVTMTFFDASKGFILLFPELKSELESSYVVDAGSQRNIELPGIKEALNLDGSLHEITIKSVDKKEIQKVGSFSKGNDLYKSIGTIVVKN